MREKFESIVKSMIQDLDGVSVLAAEICGMNPDKIKKGLQIEFIQFILYLAKSDGKFTEKENEFINEFFDGDTQIDDWEKYIEDLDFDINKPQIPKTFKVFVIADNAYYNYNRTAVNASEVYIACFKSVGELFVGVDGDVCEREIEKLSAYINSLQDYYEKETKRININKPEAIDGNFVRKIAAPRKELKKARTVNENSTRKCNKYFTVKFLNKNYDLPEDIIVFLECRNFTSNGLIKLLGETRSLMKQYQRIGGEKAVNRLDEDVANIQRIMISIVKDVYNDLLGRKIYDVDEYELYERITSIKQVESMATSVMGNMLEGATRVHNNNQAMRNNAYRSAASNITGSGVKLYTSSFTSLMVHSTVENSILKSQAKKADQEYEQALKKISASAEDQFARIFSDGIFKQFLPSLPEIFSIFQDELLKNYLLELAKHNQFNIESIEKYSEDKSITIIENIKYAEDKKSLLTQAFEVCPFNIEVYEKLLELNCFDIDTMKEAKKIFKGSELDDILDEKVRSNLKNVDLVKDYVSILSYYRGKNEKTVLMSYYQDIIKKIKENYENLFMLCTNERRLAAWINQNIDSNMDKIVIATEEDVRDKVTSWIKINIKDSESAELLSMNLMSIEDIRMKDSAMTTLEDVKLEYETKIVYQIMEYIKEANKRKIVYEEAYDKFNAELKNKNTLLDAKIAELKQQGVFAFSKKKEIKAEIEMLQKDVEEFRRTEPVQLRENYYGMYS